MAYLQILGTGPSTPITDGVGRNYRRRSSALMNHISCYFMLDVTHDFDEQVEMALSVTAAAVTNSSRDAAGGLGNLDKWTEHPLPLHVPRALYEELEERYGPFEKIFHVPTPAGQATDVGEMKVTPFVVETSSGEDGRSTFGYHFDTGKKRVCYASDLKFIPPESEQYFQNNDLLIVDGAGWDKDLPTHRGALNHIHQYAAWKNDRIIFTHIGRSAPPHSQASTSVRRMHHLADVAFDEMKLPLGR